jgi:hypothetical protein
MNKLNEFLSKHFSKIALVFLILIFFNTCGSGDIKSVNKRLDKLTIQVDSLQSITVTKEDLQIEGLKVEKRMIQSVDRKILDVNRQSEIDKEIESLQK